MKCVCIAPGGDVSLCIRQTPALEFANKEKDHSAERAFALIVVWKRDLFRGFN